MTPGSGQSRTKLMTRAIGMCSTLSTAADRPGGTEGVRRLGRYTGRWGRPLPEVAQIIGNGLKTRTIPYYLHVQLIRVVRRQRGASGQSVDRAPSPDRACLACLLSERLCRRGRAGIVTLREDSTT